MPQAYRTMGAWICEDKKTIFVGYEKKLNEMFKDTEKEDFTVFSETSQKRLGLKIVSFTKKQTKVCYTVENVSGLNTVNNVIRYYKGLK